jgi:hypothetical protein
MESRLFEDKSSAGFKSAGNTKYEISRRTYNQMNAMEQQGTCPQLLFLFGSFCGMMTYHDANTTH